MALTKEQAEQIKKQLLNQIDNLSPEQADQVEELREQIENASPEELEEFIKQQQAAFQSAGQSKCIFCEIIAGRIESVRIYEDRDILVLMEIMPASKGHILVMPKQHYQYIQEIPEKLLQKIFYFIKIACPVLVSTLDAKALSIYIPQGILAGQRVQHFLINLIPRYESDGLIFDWEHKKANNKDLEAIAGKIRKVMQNEVIKKIAKEQQKEERKRKKEQESEAEKILKHMKKRMP